MQEISKISIKGKGIVINSKKITIVKYLAYHYNKFY